MNVSSLALGLLLFGLQVSSAEEQSPFQSQALPTSAFAEDSPALLRYVAEAPSVRAAWQNAEAAGYRKQASGAWPNPQLEGMYSRLQMPEDEVPMWEVRLQQPLPKAGERSADQARASAALRMAQAEAERRMGEVAMESAGALAELDAARARLALWQTQRTRTEQALNAAWAATSSGQGKGLEALMLQSRVTELEVMALTEERIAADAAAMARGALGLKPDQALPPFSAPDPRELDPAHAPEVRMLLARQTEARAMRAMARASARPMTAVGLRYELEQALGGDEETIGVSFMTELPWFSRRTARAEAAAAEADFAARGADLEATQRAVETARTNAERAAQLAESTRTRAAQTQTRLAGEYDALMRSASALTMAGGSTALMLVEVLDRMAMVQRQVIDAEATAQRARAELWRYVPMSEPAARAGEVQP